MSPSEKDLSSAERALVAAIRVEQQGRQFYLKVAERTADEKGQAMFRSLASDELEHLDILVKEYQALTNNEPWLTVEQAKETEPMFSLFPEEGEDLAIPQDDLSALKFAMDFEQRGYEMYRKGAMEAADATAQAVFQHLAKEENRHFVLLQRTHDYLATSGVWLWDDMHPPMLDGA